MPNILTLTVTDPNPDEILNVGAYGPGAVVQVQSAAAEAGPFSDDGTVAIISGTESYIYYDTQGTSDTWYRTRYESSNEAIVSDWETPFQVSLVTLANAQARAGDSVTQEMIDGVVVWLENEIGPLVGERTETFYLSERRNLDIVDGLWLSRRTDSVTLTSDGDSLTLDTDFRLINGLLILHVSTGTSWGDTLVATYTPTDEDVVIETIYGLLTFASLPANIQSIRIGAYSETFGTGTTVQPVIGALISKVKPGTRLGRYASPFRYRKHREDRTYVEATS